MAVRLYFAMLFFSSPKEQFAALSSVLSFSVIQIFFNDPNTEITEFIAVVLAFKFYSFFLCKPITKHSVALIGNFAIMPDQLLSD